MTNNVETHSQAWKSFTIISFALSVIMVGGGILYLPVDVWMKGYLAMGVVMLVQTCVTLTKTQRDIHEAAKLVNRNEDARTERLLMEVGKSA
jgi:hypothetical protein